MSDIGAPAAPALTPAPVAPPAPPPEDTGLPPEPLKTHVDPAPKPVEKPSIRDALKSGREKVEAAEKAPAEKPLSAAEKAKAEAAKTAPKPVEAKPAEKPRGEHGHFAPDPTKTAAENAEAERLARPAPAKAPEPGQEHRAAPTRFSPEAKAAWESAPEDVQKETHRAFRELEQGITKYREPAQRYDTVFKEYDELAKRSNVDPSKVLAEYVRLDGLINNPKTLVSGVEQILNGRGITLQQFAEHVLGRPGDPNAKPQGASAEVVELRNTVAKLEARLNGVGDHLQQQQTNDLAGQVHQWSQGKEHFEMLAPRIAQFISEDKLSLDDAYAKAVTEAQEIARAFNGGTDLSSPAPKPAGTSAAEIEAQTLKGSKSITGAPGSGSAPAARQPSSSIKDALLRAKQKAL